MAETKADSTRSKSSKSRATDTKSRSASSKSRNGANAQSKRSTTGSSRSGGAASKTAASKTASRNGTEKSKLAVFVDKAKAPAAASGAALVGLAGGLALSRNKRRKGAIGRIGKPNVKLPKLKATQVKAPKMGMPKPDSALKTVSHAAGEVAERSQRVGEVASAVQMASDAITNSKRG